MNTDTNNTTDLPARLRWRRPDVEPVEGPREEVMRAYAQAGFVGTLVPVDVAEVPAPQPVTLRPGVDVDPEAAKRIAAAEAFLKARGFAPPPTWFAAGTEMLPEGRAKFGSLAKRHEDLPVFRDAAAEVIDVIRAEDRRDMVLGDARALRLTPEGTLTRGKGDIALEPNALKGIIGRFPKAFPNAWSFLALLDPAARAEAVNAQLSRLSEWYSDDERNLRLRLRNVGGWRAFAAVSPTYMPMDADRVLGAYVETLDALGLPDPRGAIAYNGETTDGERHHRPHERRRQRRPPWRQHLHPHHLHQLHDRRLRQREPAPGPQGQPGVGPDRAGPRQGPAGRRRPREPHRRRRPVLHRRVGHPA